MENFHEWFAPKVPALIVVFLYFAGYLWLAHYVLEKIPELVVRPLGSFAYGTAGTRWLFLPMLRKSTGYGSFTAYVQAQQDDR
ncbi:hypothetical protein [Herbidospora cretacea]|uniref:hypothetical protein n=1 Tax=Herbidospora cretacea TaxID=28444 RepID=UPI000AE17E6D|nr:hypothetical protein [Herbidospora cretacea]